MQKGGAERMRMKAKKKVLCTFVTICVIFIITTVCCSGDDNLKESKEGGRSTEITEGRQVQVQTARNVVGDSNDFLPPVVIWCYIGSRDTPGSLRSVLASGLVSHVSFGVGNRMTSDTLGKATTLEAIKIAKDAGVNVVLVRYLWPSKKGYISGDALFDKSYYIEETTKLRAEAKSVGADFVGFDIEPYGRSEVKHFFKGKNGLPGYDRWRLKNTVKKVIETCGKVDLIYPAGSVRRGNPYNILATMGRFRMSEHTYYNNEANRRAINYPYEIFGAYVNTTRKNELHSHLPFYLVSEIFDRPELWSEKKGLFLYPREGNSNAVAKALEAYGKSLPFPDQRTRLKWFWQHKVRKRPSKAKDNK